MKPLNINCACEEKSGSDNNLNSTAQLMALIIPSLLLWFIIYNKLLWFSKFLVFDLLGLKPDTHLARALQFFFYDTPKVIMLMSLVIFFVGIIRSFFTPERTRKMLTGKKEFMGNIMAALLGILTPFCTCSAIPLFIGFVTAGIPLGVTFSFLISAPMVNEIAVVLLYGLVGWKIAALYMGTGLIIAIVAGWIIGRLPMEKYIEDWVRHIRTNPDDVPEDTKTWAERIRYGANAVKDIVGKVWFYVVLGIAVGAFIHGYVPEAFMASIMNKTVWWSVPAAVLVGIPMYSNAAGIVPVVEALLGKGASLGTVLAFMMSVIALSLPEMLILRKVLKPALILTFIAVVGTGILMVGYLFNYLL